MHLKEALQKKIARSPGAAMISDYGLGGMGTASLGAISPMVSSAVGNIGSLQGLMSENARKDVKERGSNLKSLIPGVGQARAGAVRRAVADESGERGRKQLLHEEVGKRLGRLGGAAAGAGLAAILASRLEPGALGQSKITTTSYGPGAGISTEERLEPMSRGTQMGIAALLGAVGGAIAPDVAAALLALARKPRSKKEQQEAEKRNLALNYIPGVGQYQSLRRAKSGYHRFM
jgi:hypothetical protein